MLLHQLYEGPERRRKGTYAAVKFHDNTIKALTKLQKDLGVPEPLDPKEFHSTLLYSRRYCPDYEAAGDLSPEAVADDTKVKLQLWPSGSGTKTVLVLKYKCKWLEDRHAKLMEDHNATWDFPDYIPHITLSYNVGDWKPESKTVELSDPITIVNEYTTELELDWSDDK